MINPDLLLPGMLFETGVEIVTFVRHSAMPNAPYFTDGDIDGMRMIRKVGLSQIQPIPLTAEILRDWFGMPIEYFGDGGSEWGNGGWIAQFHEFDEWEFHIDSFPEVQCCFEGGSRSAIVYHVHEFQLWLAAHGIDHRAPWERIKKGARK